MRTRALFLSHFSLCTCLMVFTLSLAMGAPPEVTTEEESGIFTVHGLVHDEVGRPIVGMPILCWWDSESRGRQAISKEEGRFTLIGIPREAKTLRCWSPGGDTYLEYEDHSACRCKERHYYHRRAEDRPDPGGGDQQFQRLADPPCPGGGDRCPRRHRQGLGERQWSGPCQKPQGWRGNNQVRRRWVSREANRS